MKRAKLRVTVVLLVGFAAGCGSGGDGEPPFEVSSVVVSHETTRDISVWAPDSDGSWPVVYALHGTGGNRQDLAETASALARQGVVVFVADYRSAEIEHWAQDAECGYRYARSIADEYGGDLDRPVTSVGYSLGATLVLGGSLNDAAFGPGGTYQECFSGAPRADVTVAVAGCHYEYEGQVFDFDPNTPLWTNHETDLVLVAGENDDLCAAWQSKDAAAALQSAGYEVNLLEIAGANHFTLIFHDLVNDEWVTLPNEPAGQETVQAILDAIAAAEQ
jgi:acetyl esterase/lipase